MESRFDLLHNDIGRQLTKRMIGFNQVIEGSPVPKLVRELVSLRASQINGCAPCVDMHTKEAIAAGESQLRLNLVAVWRETEVFSEAERAALALAEEGTRLADTFTGVSDSTWAEVRRHFDDDQIAVLLGLIAFVNAANRLNVITRTVGGSYEPGMLAALVH